MPLPHSLEASEKHCKVDIPINSWDLDPKMLKVLIWLQVLEDSNHKANNL